jgi:hypothetical protein
LALQPVFQREKKKLIAVTSHLLAFHIEKSENMLGFSLLPVNIALIIFTLIFTSHGSETTYGANDTEYHAENCYETTPECVESFDTMVVCGARIQNPISAYLDTSFFTATQLECLCRTRGYSRNAVT